MSLRISVRSQFECHVECRDDHSVPADVISLHPMYLNFSDVSFVVESFMAERHDRDANARSSLKFKRSEAVTLRLSRLSSNLFN